MGARATRSISGRAPRATLAGVTSAGLQRIARRRAAHLASRALLCLALGCGGDAGEVTGILLVSVDTLRADALGSYGGDPDTAPHMDRLAREGTRFARTVAPSPHTLPSHATLLTGLHPLEHGALVNSRSPLPDSVTTLAERLRAAGWRTGAVVSSAVLHRRWGLDQGFEDYRDDFFSTLRGLGDARLVAEADAAATTNVARAWLREQAGAERRFLWVHYMDPHAPYAPPAPFRTRFPASPYLGEVAFVDQQLGVLLEELRSTAGAGGTLVVLTSDHGESLGAHGEQTHGHFLYDEVLRIPLILRGPGIPAGRVVEAPVGLEEVAPTLLARAGLDPGPGLPLAGAPPADRGVVSVSYLPAFSYGWSPLWSLSKAGEKLILAPRPEYYRTDEDPGEQVNRATLESERRRALEGALRERAKAYLARRSEAAPLSADPATRAELAALGYAAPSALLPERPLDELSGADPKDRVEVLGLLQRYHAARTRGDLVEARRALEAIRPLDPGNPVPDEETSLLLLLAGRFEELLAWHAGRPEPLREQPVQAYRRAVALAKLERHAEAIDALRANLRRDPSHQASRFALAELLARVRPEEGSVAEARGAYAEVLRSDPRNLAARNNLANLLIEAGDLPGARREFEILVDQYPEFAPIRQTLGEIYANLGLRGRAVEQLETYLRLAPQASNRLYVQGVIAGLEGR